MLNRKFGVEVELFNILRPTLVQKMNDAGFPCVDEGYSHGTTSHWKVVSDGSVSGVGSRSGNYTPGCELVSPPLEGEEGLRIVSRVLLLLNLWGARVNKTCGFHVHVAADDLPFGAHRRLVASYIKHEGWFDLLVPANRRRYNTFCATMATEGEDAKRTLAAINKTRTLDQLAAIVNPPQQSSGGGQQSGRYRKLNLCSFWRHGTVEFRQQGGSDEHGAAGGSIPAQEWLMWTRFCVAMVCRAKVMVEKDGGLRMLRNYRLQGNETEFWAYYVGDRKVEAHFRPKLAAAIKAQTELGQRWSW